MYRVAICVLAIAAGVGVGSASEPGQPLDCSDFVSDIPGLTCLPFLGFGLSEDDPYFGRGSNVAVDNEGQVILGKSLEGHIEIWRRNDAGEARIGYFPAIRGSPAGSDWIRFRDHRDTNGSYLGPTMTFDAANGRLLIPVASGCSGDCPCGSSCHGSGYGGRWVAAIEGFATIFEVLQTYDPPASTIGFRVPYMPEGMDAADWFDTYWGALASVGDWSQAQPLQCGYPASPPSVGDYLTVADTLPMPDPGSGYYYVTSVAYQGETRYGRQASGGQLSGRDPGALPECTE